MSKKLEDEKLEISWSQLEERSSKKSKVCPTRRVETDKEGFKDIVKAADDFASRVGSGKGVDREKIHKGKGKGDSLKEKASQIKCKSKGNPKGNPKGKRHSQTKKMETFQKTWYLPARPVWRIQARVGRKTQEKVVRKEKTTATRMAAKQRRAKSDLH